MNSSDTLGAQIRDLLTTQGIETPYAKDIGTPNIASIAGWFEQIMGELNLDVSNDDSLRDTPNRVAKMYCQEIFYGLDYDNFPKITTVENKFSYDEMLVTKCQVRSLCEHHFVPFMGSAHISYIPRTKVLGLSKFNRIVDFFSRRPQIQERLTAQIHSTLCHILETEDVAIVIKATHYCVHLRGVQDSTSGTVTSKLSGKFRTVPEARQEFLALTRA